MHTRIKKMLGLQVHVLLTLGESWLLPIDPQEFHIQMILEILEIVPVEDFKALSLSQISRKIHLMEVFWYMKIQQPP